VENLPTNALFTGVLPDVKNFRFYPNYTQSGIYAVRFIATDDSLAADTVIVNITVIDAGNQRPIFTTTLPDTQAVVIGQTLNQHLVAKDGDLDPMVITADNVIAYATFTDSGNGAALYRYQPNFSQLGSVFRVMFIVRDPLGAADTLITHYRPVQFLRGDANSDSRLDAMDVMFLINFLYKGGREPALQEAADVNFDEALDIRDASYLINYFYKQGPPPPTTK
jgi:hypothetical protein